MMSIPNYGAFPLSAADAAPSIELWIDASTLSPPVLSE